MEKRIDISKLPPELQEALARVFAGEEEAEMVPSPTQEQAMIGATSELLKDWIILEEMRTNPKLKPLLFSLSHLLRTSRIDNENTLLEMKLRFRRAARLLLLVFKKEITPEDYALFDSIVNYAYSAFEDQRFGWRGKLVTERVKIWKIEGPEQKRKGWLGWFGGR